MTWMLMILQSYQGMWRIPYLSMAINSIWEYTFSSLAMSRYVCMCFRRAWLVSRVRHIRQRSTKIISICTWLTIQSIRRMKTSCKMKTQSRTTSDSSGVSVPSANTWNRSASTWISYGHAYMMSYWRPYSQGSITLCRLWKRTGCIGLTALRYLGSTCSLTLTLNLGCLKLTLVPVLLLTLLWIILLSLLCWQTPLTLLEWGVLIERRNHWIRLSTGWRATMEARAPVAVAAVAPGEQVAVASPAVFRGPGSALRELWVAAIWCPKLPAHICCKWSSGILLRIPKTTWPQFMKECAKL